QAIVEQAVTADRVGLRPDHVDARVGIGAVSLTNEGRIVADRRGGEEVDVREVDRKEIALGIEKRRSQLIAQTQGESQAARNLPRIVHPGRPQVSLEGRVRDADGYL